MMTKYLRTYNIICDSAKKEQRNKKQGIYYENHHILPKSLGGVNDKDNLVLLTAKEHFITHFLLYKHYKSINNKPKMFKMLCAFNYMSTNNKGMRYNSKSFDIARKQFGIAISERLKGKKHSLERIKKNSEAQKGKKLSQSTKLKMSKSRKGIKFSEEHKLNMSKAAKGKPKSEEAVRKMQKSLLGYKHTDEAKINMSKARKGLKLGKQKIITCPHCFKSGGTSMKRWHFDNCKKENYLNKRK